MIITKEDRKNLKIALAGLSRKKGRKEIFYDLCFCICAPQTTFVSNRKVIEELKKRDFYKHDVINLPQICKPVRFYNNKAKHLLAAKNNFDTIMYHVNLYLKHRDKPGHAGAMREYLVDEVKGLGMKAASHFLRNLGETNLAIIDTHILKFLACNEYELKEIRKMATSKRGYRCLEFDFKVIAQEYRLSVAELDALVWKNYSNTDWAEFKY